MRGLYLWFSLCAAIIFVISLLYIYRQKYHITWHSFDGGYRIAEISNALTSKECDELMKLAYHNGMEDSYVWGKTNNEVRDNYRKSKQAWIPSHSLPVTLKMSKLSEMLTNLPQQNQEHIQIVQYDEGGRFDNHFDVCTSTDANNCQAMNSGAGERKATLLFYLNDEFSGGETVFPDIGFVSKPKKGKAILFWNTNSSEKVLWQSKHRGNSVQGGNKWIATIWSHPFSYPKVQ